MKKHKRLLACTLSATLLLGVGVVAAEEQDTNAMTRGEFVQAIVQQMSIEAQDPNTILPNDLDENSPYAQSVKALMERKVVQGYTDGTFKADQPIREQEAVWLLARIWGVDADRVPHILEEEYHLSLGQMIVHEHGVSQIKEIFQTDQAAFDLVMKSTEAQLNQDSFRSEITQEIVMEMKEPLPESTSASMEMQSSVILDFQKKEGMRIKSVSKLPESVPNGPTDMTIEQYMVPDGMFMKMNDPETGEEQWMKMGEAFPFSFDQMMDMQKNSLNINQSLLNKHVFYKDMGMEELGGTQVHKVAFRMSFGSLQEMMDVLSKNMPELAKQPMETNMQEASISMSGVMLLDATTFLPSQFEHDMVIHYKDESEKQPIKIMRMHQSGLYFDFNQVKSIELPEAAKNAQPIPMPNE